MKPHAPVTVTVVPDHFMAAPPHLTGGEPVV
jgi:hypothetical protein